MTIRNVRALANAKAKGQRPFFLADPQAERILAIAMTVAQELAVTRERLDTIERLMEAGVPVTQAAIDAYRPDDAAMRQRQAAHADYIARILRIVQQTREEIEGADDDTETMASDFAAAIAAA